MDIIQQTTLWIPVIAALIGGGMAIAGGLIIEKLKNAKNRKALAY